MNNLEPGLYDDLANALPTGIYRLRVYHDVSLLEDKWLYSKDIPYVVEFANERFYDILQLDEALFLNNPGVLHDLIFNDDKAEFAKKNVEANLKLIPFLWEGRLLINNRIRWIQFKSIPRLLENRDVIWTGTLDDITLRKQTEEAIKLKNIELQRLNADKDTLLSILAHDLRSPFNSILGCLDILATDLRRYDLDMIEQLIIAVNSSAINTFHLLEDILLWAQSQSGAMPFEPDEQNLKDSCDKVIELLKKNAENKNIHFKSIENDQIIVFADVDMLNTILRNLLSNAIKFSRSGGTIEICSEQTPSMLIVSVSDNGIGIAPDDLVKLFDPTQLYTTRGTANEKGTGFGLMLCKQFVEKHGGTIWVESTEGVGSRFYFSMPYRP